MTDGSTAILHTAIFQATLKTVPIAMAIIDRNLRYISVNEACAGMTGLPVDAHPGRSLREVNPLLSSELESAMRRVLATGEPCLNFRLTRPTPHATGGVLEIVMHITPFRDPAGEIAGICSTATDMTPWRTLQEQFFQAQKLKAVGQLAAGIAHDFNNLITVIGSYCELALMDMPPDAPQRADIEEIRKASGRAATLARRMLGTARTSAIIATPINLRTAVAAARDLLRHATPPDVTLNIECDDDTGVAMADATQIEQILLNLVINAVDAMPTAGMLTVRTRNVAIERRLLTRVGEIPPGPYVELTVSDTGFGMDAHTLSRIFEPFFTTKARDKGTGLGLATVLGIGRELRAGIDVTSTPKVGTTFRILFPQVDVEARSTTTSMTPSEAATLAGSESVLVVHDEILARAGIVRTLQRHGYRVLEAGNIGEALRIIVEDDAIALVMSDLETTERHHELSQRIRALGRDTPVLLMQTADDNAATSSAITAEADGYIVKPFAVDELVATVRRMLDAVSA